MVRELDRRGVRVATLLERNIADIEYGQSCRWGTLRVGTISRKKIAISLLAVATSLKEQSGRRGSEDSRTASGRQCKSGRR